MSHLNERTEVEEMALRIMAAQVRRRAAFDFDWRLANDLVFALESGADAIRRLSRERIDV